MRPEDALEWSLLEAVAAIRERRISSAELTELCLGQIAALQPSLNAFIAVDAEESMAAARAADMKLASGAPAGALHGVPLAHKDMFFRAGRVTTAGSKIWAGKVAEQTAAVLVRLDQAGALELGRLNMAEFAMGPTGVNAHYGRARNPWDEDLVSGGSSSGSAVAVASGMVFGALGSDTGGSIRLPAAMCGIVGLKPTSGRVSMVNTMPLSPTMDCVGPLARSVRDVALLFDIIADPLARPEGAVDRLWRQGAGKPLTGCRIGLSPAFNAGVVEADVIKALQDSQRVLAGLGATFVAIDTPRLELLGELGAVVSMYEAVRFHQADMTKRPSDYGAQVLARLREGQKFSEADYRHAQSERQRFRREFIAVFEDCDVVHAPVLGAPTPKAVDVQVEGGPDLMSMINGLTRQTRPASYLGLPALAQPVALSRHGSPLSMQLIAAPFAENRLLAVGQAFEDAVGGIGGPKPGRSG